MNTYFFNICQKFTSFLSLLVVICLLSFVAPQVGMGQNYFELPVKSPLVKRDDSCGNSFEDYHYNYNDFEGKCHQFGSKLHTGKDILGDYQIVLDNGNFLVEYLSGNPVLASGDGNVVHVKKSNSGGWGRMIILKHYLKNGGEIYSLYAHLASINVDIINNWDFTNNKPKQHLDSIKVYKGQRIGKIGSSYDGTETGAFAPHLHLEFITSPTHPYCSNFEGIGCGYEDYINQNYIKKPHDFIKTNPLDFGIQYIPHPDGCDFQATNLQGISNVLEVEPNDVHDVNGESYTIDDVKTKQYPLHYLRAQELELVDVGTPSNPRNEYQIVQGNFKPSGDLDIYTFDAQLTGNYYILLSDLEKKTNFKLYKHKGGNFNLQHEVNIDANVGMNTKVITIFCESGGKYYLEITPFNSNHNQCGAYLLGVVTSQKGNCTNNPLINNDQVANSRSSSSCQDCHDSIQNNDETGIDCGGPDCIACSCDASLFSTSIQLNAQNSSFDFRGDLESSAINAEYVMVAYVNNEIVARSQDYYQNGDRVYLGNIPCNSGVVVRALQVDDPEDCYAQVSFNTTSCQPSGPPNNQASNMNISHINPDQFYGTWDRGNGQGVIVTCTPCSLSASTPRNGVQYGANRDYSQAPRIGNSRLVYVGTDDSRLISGLSPNTCYRLRAYEYNGTGTSTQYLISNPATASATTSGVLALDFDWDPHPIAVGQAIDFDWISSLGGLSTQDWTFQGGTPSTNNTNGCCVTWNSPGTYRVTLEGWHASTDQRQTIFKDITVISANAFKPDIELTINSLNPITVSATAGQEMTVQWVAENTGYDYAKLTNSQYFLSRDQSISSNDIELVQDISYNYHGPILEYNEVFNNTKTLDLPNNLGAGSWYLLVKVNSEKALAADYPEENFSNNIASIPFTVEEELPDLALQNVSVAKTTLRSGETVSTTVIFRNLGYYDNFGCANYNIYLSKDNQLSADDNQYYMAGSSWCTNDVYAPNSSETHSRNITINPITPNGNYYLLFCFDRTTNQNNDDDQIPELNENNNVVAKPVTISNPSQPTVQVSNTQITAVSNNAISLNWTKGNGINTLIVVTAEDNSNRLPEDGQTYSTSTNWNNATPFYPSNPVTRLVYKGTGTQTTITNLTPDKTWYFTFYSFKGTGSNTDYLQANAPTILAHTKGGAGANFTKHYLEAGNNDFELGPIFDVEFSENKSLAVSFGRNGRMLVSNDQCTSYHLEKSAPSREEIYAGEILANNTVLGFTREGKVFKSPDGGNNWTYSEIDNYTSIGKIYDSHFLDSQTGFVLARRTSDNAGLMYKTNDGGTSWSLILSAPNLIFKITAQGSILWASGQNGLFIKSTNQGDSWTTLAHNLGNSDIGNIQFISTNTGYCSTSSNVYKTVNGGLNWTNIRNATTDVTLRTVHFISEEVGFILNGNTSASTLLKTINGGATWSTVTSVDFGIYYGLEVCSEEEVWLYGDHLTKVSTCNASTFYLDNDNDGYGDAQTMLQSCNAPVGYVNNSSDCDDTDPNINPDALEICDNLDNDCSGTTDDNISRIYYADSDGDGFGAGNPITVNGCSPASNLVLNNADCDDSNPNVYLGAIEICDGLDNNCDGNIDEGEACSENCEEFWVITDPQTATPLFQAVHHIITDGIVTIESHQEVTLEAEYIELNDGFDIEPGAFFEAKIEPCALSNLIEVPLENRDNDSTPAKKPIPCEEALSIYPNPFQSQTTIAFEIQHNSPVIIKLFDMTGKKVSTLLSTNQATIGKHTLRLERLNMPKGMYFCTFQTNTCLVSKEIIIQ